MKKRNGLVFMNGKTKSEGLTYVRSQLPFILGYAITIHGCQGMTLDSAIVDLGYSIFLPAQAYVALSRVKTLEGLYISKITERSFQADEEAVNYMKKIFPNNIWALMDYFDKEACEDFVEEIAKIDNTSIKTNSIGFIDFLNSKLNVEPSRLNKKVTEYSHEKMYNLYIKDPPAQIYGFFKGDKEPEYLDVIRKVVNDKYTKVVNWRIDI